MADAQSMKLFFFFVYYQGKKTCDAITLSGSFNTCQINYSHYINISKKEGGLTWQNMTGTPAFQRLGQEQEKPQVNPGYKASPYLKKKQTKTKKAKPFHQQQEVCKEIEVVCYQFHCVLSQCPHQYFKGPCQFLLYLFSLEKQQASGGGGSAHL